MHHFNSHVSSSQTLSRPFPIPTFGIRGPSPPLSSPPPSHHPPKTDQSHRHCHNLPRRPTHNFHKPRHTGSKCGPRPPAYHRASQPFTADCQPASHATHARQQSPQMRIDLHTNPIAACNPGTLLAALQGIGFSKCKHLTVNANMSSQPQSQPATPSPLKSLTAP